MRTSTRALGALAAAGIATLITAGGSPASAAPSGDQPWYDVTSSHTVQNGDQVAIIGSCFGQQPTLWSDAFLGGEALVEQPVGDPFSASAVVSAAPGDYDISFRCSGENPGSEHVTLHVI